MLNIYPVALLLAKDAAQLAAQIAPHDADLARQMRRACTSVPLNLAEGSCSQGRNRAARYHSALGSARETLACAETAQAIGYIPAINVQFAVRANQVIGTLVKLLRK